MIWQTSLDRVDNGYIFSFFRDTGDGMTEHVRRVIEDDGTQRGKLESMIRVLCLLRNHFAPEAGYEPFRILIEKRF
jgi:hypothetical protein